MQLVVCVQVPFFHALSLLSHTYVSALAWNSANRVSAVINGEADFSDGAVAQQVTKRNGRQLARNQ